MRNILLIVLLFIIVIGYVCPIVVESASSPTVTTGGYVNVENSSLIAYGELVSHGSSTTIEIGFCYNTTGTPTIADNTVGTVFAITLGEYFFEIDSLSFDTYYIRAFATNSNGTGYGEIISVNTLPDYSDNTLNLDFNPEYIISGTISDTSSYFNDASYILASMIDGVTVYVSSEIAGGGGFYPTQSDTEVINKWTVPPQSGMTQMKDPSNLPLYDLFSDSADQIGIEVAYLYIMMTFGLAMGLGFLFFLISGNILISIIAMIIMLTGFFSTGVMPLWIIIFFAAFAIGLIYVSRQT